MMTQEEFRLRFHELGAQEAAIREKATPLREARDKHVQTAHAKELKLNAEVKAAEEGLFDIMQERAFICRVLKGETGAPPA